MLFSIDIITQDAPEYITTHNMKYVADSVETRLL